MRFGPTASQYTASTLEAERRRKHRRLLTLGGMVTVVALLAAGIWVLSYDGDRTAADQSPVAARQAADAIRETVEDRPKSPEGEMAVNYTETIRTVGKQVQAPGTWATKKIFAKGFGDYIQGFRPGS